MQRMKIIPVPKIHLTKCAKYNPRNLFSANYTLSLPGSHLRSVPIFKQINKPFPKVPSILIRSLCTVPKHSVNTIEEMLEQGKVSQALESLSRTIQESEPKQKIDLFMQQVDICLAYKKYEEGIQICQSILDYLTTKTDAPMNIVAIFVLKMAEFLHRSGKLEDAIIEYSSTIPLLQDPVYLEHAYRRLAYALSDLYKQQGNDDVLILQQAVDYFRKAIEVSDRLCLNPVESTNDTNKAARSHPPGSPEANKVDAIYGRALCYIQLQNRKEASDDLQHIVKLDPEFAPAYFYLGEIRRQADDFMTALGFYQVYFDKFPKYFSSLGPDAQVLNSEELLSDLLCKQGYCYLKITDLNMAENCFNAVINSGRFHVDKAFHMKGKCAQQKADWWKVVELNTEAMKANPNLGAAFGDRSEAYTQLGLLEEAKEDQTRFRLLQRQAMWSPQNW